MINLIVAFFTGLTTGGLSCLAVQGGLLASSLANQIEKDVQGKQNGTARPILAFLASKLLAYTLLGFILGMAGQMFQLSPLTRAVLQIAVGVFMLGTALRMLNVHPFFRLFAIETPSFIRRKLRRTAAQSSSPTLVTPALLGLMTVFIPCGVTQAMLAVALGTADPWAGASLMAAFTLGTSPVFFTVAYFATRLGERLEQNFTRLAAVVILILGLVTIDSGLTLAGSPVSITRLWQTAVYPDQSSQAEVLISASDISQGDIITLQVENTGYNPSVLHAQAGVPLRLHLVTQNVRSCSRAFVIPSLNKQLLLDATGDAYIEIPAQEAGTRMPFSCSMGMYTGEIVFDL